MSGIVKVKALSAFSDSVYGNIVKGGFYKLPAARAKHWVDNGLGEEIVVQKLAKPAKVENKVIKAPKTSNKAKVTNGKGGKSNAGKGTASRNK